MPSSLEDLIVEKQIAIDLKKQTQAEALRELIQVFESNPYVHDLDGFYEALLSREKVNSTVVGNGIAFPHARTDCVDRIVLAAGRSVQGVRFSNNSEPVHLIFVIGTPKALISDYLVCVGALARSVKDKGLCDGLMSAKTPAEFAAVLKPKK